MELVCNGRYHFLLEAESATFLKTQPMNALVVLRIREISNLLVSRIRIECPSLSFDRRTRLANTSFFDFFLQISSYSLPSSQCSEIQFGFYDLVAWMFRSYHCEQQRNAHLYINPHYHCLRKLLAIFGLSKSTQSSMKKDWIAPLCNLTWKRKPVIDKANLVDMWTNNHILTYRLSDPSA